MGVEKKYIYKYLRKPFEVKKMCVCVHFPITRTQFFIFR